MIKWFTRTEAPAPLPSEAEKKASFFSRFKKSLSKTKSHLGDGLAALLLGKKTIDAPLMDEVETLLLCADLGMETTTTLLKALPERLTRKDLDEHNAVFEALKLALCDLLLPCEKPLSIPSAPSSPFVILMVGVNGAGKTTTIAKLAQQFRAEGKKVLLAAGDTFRAAAVEQLKVWGARHEIPVIAQASGSDSASVVYDALQSAKAKGYDVLIVDTAGRLHTQMHLMEELKKMKRVLQTISRRPAGNTAGIGCKSWSKCIESGPRIS